MNIEASRANVESRDRWLVSVVVSFFRIFGFFDYLEQTRGVISENVRGTKGCFLRS